MGGFLVKYVRVTALYVKMKVASWSSWRIFEREENSLTARSLCHCVFLAFLKRCLGHSFQDLGLLTSNFSLCTWAPSLYYLGRNSLIEALRGHSHLAPHVPIFSKSNIHGDSEIAHVLGSVRASKSWESDGKLVSLAGENNGEEIRPQYPTTMT